MLEVLLLGDSVPVLAVVIGRSEVETCGTRLAVGGRQTGLWVDDGMAALGCLDERWVLLLEQLEGALGFPGPDAVRCKDKVHFFQGALVGFGVESPDHGDGNDIGGTENVVGLLSEGFEDVWQHHSKPAIADGPANNTPGVTFGTDFQGKDLSRVQPWYCEPGGAESGCEKEDHGNSAVSITLGSVGVTVGLGRETSCCESAGTKHGNPLNARAPGESPPTTDPVKCEDTDEGCQHISDGVKTRDPLDRGVGDTSSAEDGGSEDGDTSNSNPLLHDLQPDDELDTTASVELARSDTEEHVEIRLGSSRLALKLSNISDILKLCLSLAEVLAALATKTAENVAGFLLTTDLDQPTGGLGEEPDDCKEDEQEENLEGDWEPPGEGCGSSFVKVAAVFEPVRNDDTANIQGEFDCNELASRGVLGRLGGPDGNDSVEHASTPAVDQASC